MRSGHGIWQACLHDTMYATNVTAEQHARSANAAKDVGLRERSGADRVNREHEIQQRRNVGLRERSGADRVNREHEIQQRRNVGLRERSGADRVNQIHIDIYL